MSAVTAPHTVPFNRPGVVGKELDYVAEAVTTGRLAPDGMFTEKCANFLQSAYGIRRVMMTPSATAALEIAAQLVGISEGDEVIMPSFTFVSTANAVVRLGGLPVFVDIRPDTLNIDERLIEQAITPRTRAIMPVHYGGVASEMNTIGRIAEQRGISIIEDAAQAIDAYYNEQALGSIGTLGVFSFHVTKNITCGEGGALCIQDPALIERAEILRDKGTNRRKFMQGLTDKYSWIDIGASCIQSELNSAFLLGQLEHIAEISSRRRLLFNRYTEALRENELDGQLQLPKTPSECKSNHHVFYVLFNTNDQRDDVMKKLRADGVMAAFHYVPLHNSPMGLKHGRCAGELPITEALSSRLLRLPMFYELSDADQDYVIDRLKTHLLA